MDYLFIKVLHMQSKISQLERQGRVNGEGRRADRKGRREMTAE